MEGFLLAVAALGFLLPLLVASLFARFIRAACAVRVRANTSSTSSSLSTIASRPVGSRR